MLKKIRNFLIILVIFGVSSAFIDYFRMNSGQAPIFNISKYDESTKIQSYRGLFYQASRKVKVSTNESLVDSSDIEYTVLNQKLKVPKQYKEHSLDFTIKTKVNKSCTTGSVLYYADLDTKIYLYCIDEINVTSENKTKSLLDYLKKDSKFMGNFDNNLAYNGLSNDMSTEVFTDLYNLSNNGLTMYKCHRTNVNDVYLAPKGTSFQNDFCTYKDDDFKFIWGIKQEDEQNSTDNINEGPEVFYEDETYRYEFNKIGTLDRTFIVTPEVRGKVATSTPLRSVLLNNVLTIKDLEDKGLKFNKIDKAKEKEELEKKAAEEAKKQQEEATKQQTNQASSQNQ